MKRFQNGAEAKNFIAAAREQLLIKHARQARTRLLAPLIRRLRRDGFVSSAAVLGIVARGGDTTRAAIVQLLNVLLERVGTFTPAEIAASAAFRELLDDATETVQ